MRLAKQTAPVLEDRNILHGEIIRSSVKVHSPASKLTSSAIKQAAGMDHATCHVVYVDKRAYMDRYEERSGPRASLPPTILPESMGGFGLEPEEVQLNLRNLLTVFPGGTSEQNLGVPISLSTHLHNMRLLPEELDG